MKKSFKVLFCGLLLLGLTLVFASCDEIKKIVSDVTETAVESQVNELLKDAGVKDFQLPEAKYYNGSISKVDGVTYYKVKVEGPTVTKEEYIAELTEMLGEEFDMTELEGITEYTLEYEGTIYHFQFSETESEAGDIIWNLDVSANLPEQVDPDPVNPDPVDPEPNPGE